jgi:hypothetical protein
MDDASEEEFVEEFGYSLRLPDLERLLVRARETGDRELRLLVHQHQTLRRTAADFLAYVEDRDAEVAAERAAPGAPVSYPLGFLRLLLRDEPRRPKV